MLEQMSGQPARPQDPHHIIPNNCSKRIEEMAKPKQPHVIEDITRMTDYRGLIHADSQLALEALFPGSGHEESLRIKAQNTANSRAERHSNEQNEAEGTRTLLRSKSDTSLQGSMQGRNLSKNSVPTSQSRIEAIAQRTNDEVYARFAKEQYLPCEAPPAPNQKETLLKEDWSPATTKADPKRGTGDFTRSAQGTWGAGAAKTQESIPPPTRSVVYPMLTPMAERTRKDTADRLIAADRAHTVKGDEGLEDPNMSRDGNIIGQFVIDSPRSSPMSGVAARKMTRSFTKANTTCGSSTLSRGFVEQNATTAALCAELDQFEAALTSSGPAGTQQPGNFLLAQPPHGTGQSWWQSEQAKKYPAPQDEEDRHGFMPPPMFPVHEQVHASQQFSAEAPYEFPDEDE
jgi:hypothetical protein